MTPVAILEAPPDVGGYRAWVDAMRAEPAPVRPLHLIPIGVMERMSAAEWRAFVCWLWDVPNDEDAWRQLMRASGQCPVCRFPLNGIGSSDTVTDDENGQTYHRACELAANGLGEKSDRLYARLYAAGGDVVAWWRGRE